jgi:chorismate dehydratase
MLKVGIIDYVNSLPFLTAFENKTVTCPCEIVKDIPVRLNDLLAKNKLDVSLVSSAEYLNKQDSYQILSNYCIGARQEVLSVKLYTKDPIEKLTNQTIGLTTQSYGSVKLVEVFCHHFWNIQPNFKTFNNISEAKNFPAFLLIGDLCLKNPNVNGYQSIDLAQEWYKHTGLPFTFAVFAVRNEVLQKKAEAIKVFEKSLTDAVIWAKKNPLEVSKVGAEKSGLPIETVSHYLHLLNFSFDKGQQKGLDYFGRLIEKLPQHQMVS